MKKVFICCMSGVTTGLLVQKIELEVSKRELPLEVEALPINVLVERLSEADAILLSPQVAFVQSGIREASDVPLASIDPDVYARADVAAIVDAALELLASNA